MTVSVWGNLAKSQDDNETVEEAIARLIAEHGADETAHLGTGESLQSHKASEIIDHLIGSIVADKISDKQKIFITNFDSKDAFLSQNGIVQIGWPGVFLQTAGSVGANARIATDTVGTDWLDWSLNPMFQCILQLNNTSSVEGYFGIGQEPGDETDNFFGFKFVNGALYGHFANGVDSIDVELTGVTLTNENVYRVVIDYANNLITWYVNGVNLGEYTIANYPSVMPASLDISITTNNTTNKSLSSKQVIVAHD